MEFLGALTDDEIALLGCVAAFVGSAAIMWVSYFIGQSTRREQSAERALLLGKTAPAMVHRAPVSETADKAA